MSYVASKLKPKLLRLTTLSHEAKVDQMLRKTSKHSATAVTLPRATKTILTLGHGVNSLNNESVTACSVVN